MIEAQNLDTASIKLSKQLIENGIIRKTRGFDCIELPNPVVVCILNPHNRYVFIKGRKASKTLPFGESLALLSGVNDITLYSDYVSDMSKYSDDSMTQRAGYGPRIRGFIGVGSDYENFLPVHLYGSTKPEDKIIAIDQLKYVYKILKHDPNSRQAVISITDPANDQFENESGDLKLTKDIPCCRLLQFMIVDGKLNCTAYFRSNDILFGFQQVNVFNNTFIQECLAMMLGVKVGKYYHIANNMHFYSDKEEVLLNNANAKEEDYQDQFDWQGYNTKLSFKEFNYLLTELFSYREQLSNLEIETLISFKNDFFDDWAKVFYRFHTSDKSVNFVNPYINLLFNRPKYKPDTKQVKVNQDGFWGVYEVFNEEAYLKKCRKEGKEAHYLGRVDKYGYLNK